MQQLELLGRNGAGANSTVYKCRNKVFGDLVAVKKLEGATVQQALQEAAIMRICSHENCVTLLEVQQGISTGTVFLVMENVEHSLSREFLLNPRGLPLCKAKRITFQLAQALEHIHNMKFIHGDIKPANILLTSQYNVKLCDFGSASSAVTSSYEEQNTAVFGVLRTPIGLVSSYPTPGMGPAAPGVVGPTAAASRWYCAPESLLGAPGSPASDIWALGCVLVELLTGRPLMPGGDGELNQLSLVVSMIGALSPEQERLVQLLPAEQRASVEAARARGPLLDKIPKLATCPPLLDVVRACLHPDPAARPTARELQSMPFYEDLRAALQASKDAGAEDKTRGGSPPSQLSRRSSSGNMDVDMKGTPDTAGAIAVSMDKNQAWPAAPADAAKDSATKEGSKVSSAVMPPAASQPPLRHVGGVQAAAPMRAASRSRVSALTATLRGNPFGDDPSYRDLMPQVLELVAQWEEERRVEALGPIAVAARRRNSSCFTSPRTLPSGGESDEMGSSTTPAAVVTIAGGTVSPMASSPCAPAAIVMAPALSVVATPTVSLAVKATIPVSVSVGALSCLVKTTGVTPYSPAFTFAAAAASKPTPALLRSRAILNRARKHYNRETRFGPDCMSIFASSCPRAGLGNGASLLQQELSIAGGGMSVRRLKLSSAQGARRSFADLTTLTSVGEHGTLRCETPPEGKRRRGLVAVSSQTSLISQSSLLMEPSLGSLRENAPYLGRASPLFGASSRRMRRSNSINGLAAGSPVRSGGWQGMLPGGAGVIGVVAARAVNIPQPGAGRNRHARV